jgi:hypothetical protein
MVSMKRVAASAFAGLVFVLACEAQTQPAKGPSSLTEEQLNVYRSWLDIIGVQLHIKNLANVTVPFDFKGFPEGRPCLQGIELESPPEYLRTTHKFGDEIAKGRELRLVDRHEQLQLFRKRAEAPGSRPNQAAQDGPEAKNALNFLIFSEIAFDTGHRFAVLKYILVCGEHCDSGATRVMEKVGGRWTAKPRLICAGFFNNSFSEMEGLNQ